MVNPNLGPAVKVMTASIQTKFDFDCYNSHNIFNKLSDSSEYGFYYYPYGYLFRYPKWGQINSLGFRTKYELEWFQIHRDDIYLVQFYGGSTGFDILVDDEHTISQLIENFMNENASQHNIRKPVHVLNLSQPGNVLLNQISNYMNFGYLLKPDMVISHHGANDIATGLVTDSALLNKYSITYPDVQETWSKVLHNSSHTVSYDFADHTKPDFKPVDLKNFPPVVAQAYFERVKQFKEIVESQNIKFVSGFQPWITSKENLHPDEFSKNSSYNPYYKINYAACKSTFELSESIFNNKFGDNGFVNMHRFFKTLDSALIHFGDVCHLTEIGDQEAASCYNKYILAILTK